MREVILFFSKYFSVRLFYEADLQNNYTGIYSHLKFESLTFFSIFLIFTRKNLNIFQFTAISQLIVVVQQQHLEGGGFCLI